MYDASYVSARPFMGRVMQAHFPSSLNLSTIFAYVCCYIAATDDYHSLKAWCLLGAVIGGWVANSVYSTDLGVRQRNIRWVANVGAAFLIGLPVGRWIARKIGEEFSSEFAMCGGGISGLFAVSVLISLKKYVPMIIELIISIKLNKKP